MTSDVMARALLHAKLDRLSASVSASNARARRALFGLAVDTSSLLVTTNTRCVEAIADAPAVRATHLAEYRAAEARSRYINR